MSLLFGTSGIPASTADALVSNSRHGVSENTVNGIKRVAELGLGCMELAFVHSIYIKEKEAQEVKETALANNIKLSCHAPYYINLNAKEDEKIARSHQYILQSAKIANMCGADTVVLHAGFYLGMDAKEVYKNIKYQMEIIQDKLDEANNPIKLRPEVMGKSSQFGTFQELLQMAAEDNRISLCVDFAHWHAREGKFNTYEEFDSLLKDMKNTLGEDAIKNVHFHSSGIEYSSKGEIKHLPFSEADFRYEEMIQAWIDNDIEGKIICESPIREIDTLFLQETYQKLKNNSK